MNTNFNTIRTPTYVALLFLFLLAGCGSGYELEDYSKVEADKSGLVLGLVSYMSLDEVKEALLLKASEIVVTDDSSSPRQEGIPPFDILTVRISNTEIEGFKGAVSLTFFNGRLMEVRFFPVDVSGFVQSINGLSQSDAIEIKPYTKVWYGKDYQENAYVVNMVEFYHNNCFRQDSI